MLLAPHRPDPVALLQFPVEQTRQGDDATVGIIVGIEDEGPRRLVLGLWRRDAGHDRVEDPFYVLSGLGGDLDDLLLSDAEQFYQLLGDGRDVGYGEVYLVEHGYDLEVMLHR